MSGSEGQGTTPGAGPSIFGQWLSGFLLAAALILFDPLGISGAADRASERIILSASAQFARSPAAGGRETAGQKAITVVLVDDAFLAEYRRNIRADATWPIPRGDQLDLILAPILDRAPAALFIDWVFHSTAIEPPQAFAASLGQMADQLEAVGAGTRVLFSDRPARLADDNRLGCAFRRTSPGQLAASSQAHPALVELLAGTGSAWAERVPVRWWGPPHRYPLAPLALGEAPAGDDCPPFGPGERVIASPALALFGHWCSTAAVAKHQPLCRAGTATGERVAGYPVHRLPAPLAEPSAPRWLAWPSAGRSTIAANAALAEGAAADPCAKEARAHPMVRLLRSLRLRAGREEEEVPFNPCFGINTISATALRTVMVDAEGNPAGLNDATLDALFTGRLVLVGTDLDAAPDRAESPVNGASPAVLLHAAALENLISDGARRPREPPDGAIPWGLVASLAIAAVAAFPLGPILAGPVADTAQRIAGCAGAAARVAIAASAVSLGLACVALLTADAMDRLLIPLAGIALAGLALWAILAGTAPFAGPAAIAARLGGVVLPLGLAGGLFVATHWAPANWISGLAAKLTMLGGIEDDIEQGWRRLARAWPAIGRKAIMAGLLVIVLMVALGGIIPGLSAPWLPFVLMGAGALASFAILGRWSLVVIGIGLLLWLVPSRSTDLLLVLAAFFSALTLMTILSPLVARALQLCHDETA